MEEKFIKKILPYLNNELTSQDRNAFDQAMERDKNLAAEVELYRDLYEVHEVMEDEDLAATIQGASDTYFNTPIIAQSSDTIDLKESKKRPNTIFRSILSIAAGFLLLLMLSIWWAEQNYSNEVIIAEFHQPILDDTQADKTKINETLKEGEKAFFQEDFTKAIALLSNLPETDSEDFYKGNFILAYAYFRNENYTQAINLFNQLSNQYYPFLPPTYKNKDKIRWTILLAHIGNEQENEAFFRQELAYFLNSKSEFYKKEAESLQAKLDHPLRHIRIN